MITSRTSLTVPSVVSQVEQGEANKAQGVEQTSPLPNLMNYQEAVLRIQKLNEIAKDNESDADTRRNLRDVEIDIAQKRQNNELAPDEVYTPIRLIDQNIRREQSKYVAYLKQPQRAAFFFCIDTPPLSTELLAADFTKRFRYTGWDIPFYSHVDRMQLHGYAVMEVQYDLTKPGRFYNDDVPFEDFLMARDTRDLQANEMVGRRYHKTRSQIYAMIRTHGFSEEQVREIFGEHPTAEHDMDSTLYCVEKIFFRVEGTVHVGWSCEGKCSDWLREPRPFHNGRVELDQNEEIKAVFEQLYPFVLFPYQISENKKVTELKGRAHHDEYQQEAATSLQSSYCTAHRRSSAPYFSLDDDAPGGSEIQNIKLVPGAIIPKKVSAFQLTPPDSNMLTAVQGLVTQSSQEAGHVNYAANNRVDSRKTATEIQSAQAENALLATTQTALLSSSMSTILKMDWAIFASQVLAGLIETPVPVDYYARKYEISPAGDIEVVARQEKLSNMFRSWEIIANTPIAPEFLKRLLMLMFPEDAMVYNAMLVADEQKVQVITGLWQIIQTLAIDPLTGQLEENIAPFIGELQQLGQIVEQIIGSPSPFSGMLPEQQEQQPSAAPAPEPI